MDTEKINKSRQVYWDLIEQLRILKMTTRLRRLLKKESDLILIHTPGRVGTMTLYKTIENSGLGHKLFGTHFLNMQTIEKGIKGSKIHHRHIQPHLKVATLINKALIENGFSGELKILTPVRDPVSRDFSAFFMDIEKFSIPDFFEKYESGEIGCDEIIDTFIEHRPYFSRDEWFTTEVKEPLGIDILSREFDFKRGYNIYKNNNVSLLLYRLEDSGWVITKAIKEFLGVVPHEVTFRNISARDDKKKRVYKELLPHFLLPRDLVKKIYSNDYVRHLYTKDEINQAITRWSK